MAAKLKVFLINLTLYLIISRLITGEDLSSLSNRDLAERLFMAITMATFTVLVDKWNMYMIMNVVPKIVTKIVRGQR